MASEESVDFWLPDHLSKHCMHCSKAFSLFTRRHHCRWCGKIFCSSCSSTRKDLRMMGGEASARLCAGCVETVEAEQRWLRERAEAERAPLGIMSPLGTQYGIEGTVHGLHLQVPPQAARAVAVGRWLAGRQAPHAAPSDAPAKPLAPPGGGDAAARRHIASQMHPTGSMVRAYAPAHIAALAGDPRPSTDPARRRLRSLQQVAHAHLLLLLQRWVAFIPGLATSRHAMHWVVTLATLATRVASTVTPNVVAGDSLDVDRYHRVKAIPGGTAVEVSRSLAAAVASGLGDALARSGTLVAPVGVQGPGSEAGVAALWASTPASLPTDRHSQPVRLTHLPQLMAALERGWEAAGAPAPRPATAQPTSPAQEGDPWWVGPCSITSGVVFRGNIAHKSMASDISSPRLVLLMGGVGLSNVTSGQGHVSTDSLYTQADAYIRLCVAKLVALQPDVLLCSGEVSHEAMAALREKNVTVVHNVKGTVLNRVARATGATPLRSVHSAPVLSSAVIVGSCSAFRVVQMAVTNTEAAALERGDTAPPADRPTSATRQPARRVGGLHRKRLSGVELVPYVALEGCRPDLAATTLLRGGSSAVLVCKVLLRLAVQAAAAMRSDTALLYHLGAIPPAWCPLPGPRIDAALHERPLVVPLPPPAQQPPDSTPPSLSAKAFRELQGVLGGSLIPLPVPGADPTPAQRVAFEGRLLRNLTALMQLSPAACWWLAPAFTPASRILTQGAPGTGKAPGLPKLYGAGARAERSLSPHAALKLLRAWSHSPRVSDGAQVLSLSAVASLSAGKVPRWSGGAGDEAGGSAAPGAGAADAATPLSPPDTRLPAGATGSTPLLVPPFTSLRHWATLGPGVHVALASIIRSSLLPEGLQVSRMVTHRTTFAQLCPLTHRTLPMAGPHDISLGQFLASLWTGWEGDQVRGADKRDPSALRLALFHGHMRLDITASTRSSTMMAGLRGSTAGSTGEPGEVLLWGRPRWLRWVHPLLSPALRSRLKARAPSDASSSKRRGASHKGASLDDTMCARARQPLIAGLQLHDAGLEEDTTPAEGGTGTLSIATASPPSRSAPRVSIVLDGEALRRQGSHLSTAESLPDAPPHTLQLESGGVSYSAASESMVEAAQATPVLVEPAQLPAMAANMSFGRFVAAMAGYGAYQDSVVAPLLQEAVTRPSPWACQPRPTMVDLPLAGGYDPATPHPGLPAPTTHTELMFSHGQRIISIKQTPLEPHALVFRAAALANSDWRDACFAELLQGMATAAVRRFKMHEEVLAALARALDVPAVYAKAVEVARKVRQQEADEDGTAHAVGVVSLPGRDELLDSLGLPPDTDSATLDSYARLWEAVHLLDLTHALHPTSANDGRAVSGAADVASVASTAVVTSSAAATGALRAAEAATRGADSKGPLADVPPVLSVTDTAAALASLLVAAEAARDAALEAVSEHLQAPMGPPLRQGTSTTSIVPPSTKPPSPTRSRAGPLPSSAVPPPPSGRGSHDTLQAMDLVYSWNWAVQELEQHLTACGRILVVPDVVPGTAGAGPVLATKVSDSASSTGATGPAEAEASPRLPSSAVSTSSSETHGSKVGSQHGSMSEKGFSSTQRIPLGNTANDRRGLAGSHKRGGIPAAWLPAAGAPSPAEDASPKSVPSDSPKPTTQAATANPAGAGDGGESTVTQESGASKRTSSSLRPTVPVARQRVRQQSGEHLSHHVRICARPSGVVVEPVLSQKGSRRFFTSASTAPGGGAGSSSGASEAAAASPRTQAGEADTSFSRRIDVDLGEPEDPKVWMRHLDFPLGRFDTVVNVSPNLPGSIIAYTLASHPYLEKLSSAIGDLVALQADGAELRARAAGEHVPSRAPSRLSEHSGRGKSPAIPIDARSVGAGGGAPPPLRRGRSTTTEDLGALPCTPPRGRLADVAVLHRTTVGTGGSASPLVTLDTPADAPPQPVSGEPGPMDTHPGYTQTFSSFADLLRAEERYSASSQAAPLPQVGKPVPTHRHRGGTLTMTLQLPEDWEATMVRSGAESPRGMSPSTSLRGKELPLSTTSSQDAANSSRDSAGAGHTGRTAPHPALNARTRGWTQEGVGLAPRDALRVDVAPTEHHTTQHPHAWLRGPLAQPKGPSSAASTGRSPTHSESEGSRGDAGAGHHTSDLYQHTVDVEAMMGPLMGQAEAAAQAAAAASMHGAPAQLTSPRDLTTGSSAGEEGWQGEDTSGPASQLRPHHRSSLTSLVGRRQLKRSRTSYASSTLGPGGLHKVASFHTPPGGAFRHRPSLTSGPRHTARPRQHTVGDVVVTAMTHSSVSAVSIMVHANTPKARDAVGKPPSPAVAAGVAAAMSDETAAELASPRRRPASPKRDSSFSSSRMDMRDVMEAATVATGSAGAQLDSMLAAAASAAHKQRHDREGGGVSGPTPSGTAARTASDLLDDLALGDDEGVDGPTLDAVAWLEARDLQAFGVPLSTEPAVGDAIIEGERPPTAFDIMNSDAHVSIMTRFVDQRAAPSGSGKRAGKTTYTINTYWACQFHALREIYLGSQRGFVESLAHSSHWDTTGGKSDAEFWRTHDQRFVLKAVSETEFAMFLEGAAGYFQHMGASLQALHAHTAGKPARPSKAAAPAGPQAAAALFGRGNVFDTYLLPGDKQAALRDVSQGQVVAAAAAGRGTVFWPWVMSEESVAALAKQRRSESTGVDTPTGGAAGVPTTWRLVGGVGTGAPASLLVKVFGVYRLDVKDPASGLQSKRFVLVMENLWHGVRIHRHMRFDLKGKMRQGKDVEKEGGEKKGGDAPSKPSQGAAAARVMLDDDFFAFTGGTPLPLTEGAYDTLIGALEYDTQFLADSHIMDYSLLVGVDPQRHLLVVGIIDYLRQWDWVKQGELTIKAAAAIVTNVEPTVQPPKKYAQRLLNCARRCFAQFAPQRALSQVPLLPPLHVSEDDSEEGE